MTSNYRFLRDLILGVIIATGALFLFSLASCAHGPAITDGLEGVALDCGREVQPAILPAIESALASSDWRGQLELLAGKTAVCVVSRGVAFVVDELTSGHARLDATSLTKSRNGQNWLELHPVN